MYYTPAEKIVNPSFTGTEPAMYQETGRVNISNETFDLSRIENFKTFFDGFISSDGKRKFEYLSSNDTLMYGSLQVKSLAVASKAIILSVTRTSAQDWVYDFSYEGKKELMPVIGSLKDYVVSNNPNAYPDKGVKGDYYYELLGSVPTATVYGITSELTNSIKDNAIAEVQEVITNVD